MDNNTLPTDEVMEEMPFDPQMIFGPQGPQKTEVNIQLSPDVSVHLTITTDGPATTVNGSIEGTDVADPDTINAAVSILQRLL